LVCLIKNYEGLRKDIFSKINYYIPQESDFLSPEETENFKFFKGLIDNKIIDKEFEYKGANYITKVETNLSALEEKIIKFEIKYNDISLFFQNEKIKNKLKEKLLYLNILDEVKTQKNIESLENKVKEIKNKIDDFELIFSDFRYFFYKKHNIDLDKLSKICFDLKNECLNYFEKKYLDEYKYYSKYLDGAKRRLNLKRSTFFNEILKLNKKNLYKNNEEKALQETESTFNKLNKIFEKEGIMQINEKLLEVCVKPFTEKIENLKNELKILSDIFNINAPIDYAYESILLLSKREFIFNTASAIDIFIDKINPKKTEFSKSIKNIISKMKEKRDIQTIKTCNNKLIELEILKEEEKENKLINILLVFFKFNKKTLVILLKILEKNKFFIVTYEIIQYCKFIYNC
jgi:hypothetical protein